MGSYGRNFDYRTMPHGSQRGSRFMLSTAANVPIGTPLVYDGSIDTSAFGPDNAVLGVRLALGAQPPRVGLDGIGVYEYAPAAFAGFDPVLTRYSDLDFIPAGKLCQVVNGVTVKVVLTNTAQFSFDHVRTYAGRTMIAGFGGATSVSGNDLEPGVTLSPGGGGTDTTGYWAVTATAADVWLTVTGASFSNLEAECKLAF